MNPPSRHESHRYLYLVSSLDQRGEFADESFAMFTERHRVVLPMPKLEPVEPAAIDSTAPDFAGVVIEMLNGWPWPAHLRLAKRWVRAGKRAFFYWPGESAIEVADEERIRSYWHLCVGVWVGTHALSFFRRFRGLGRGLLYRLAGPSGQAPAPATVTEAVQQQTVLEGLDAILANPMPADLRPALKCVAGRWSVKGRGVYLRTDYWARISSGGSYGHTCHVANELAKASGDLVCFMAHRYRLLDEMGLRQVVVRPPFEECGEESLLVATPHFYTQLRAAIEALAPAYIYERAVMGNFAGAQLSRELSIPYLLEYNGSEISMNKSFGSGGYAHEADFLRIEDAAFRQAAVISVISDPVKTDVVGRGIDPAKILVNPNGVDTKHYRPPAPEETAALRVSLDFTANNRVIGFIGTFGGWHGVDTLAEALPLICERAPAARFLLIGDGYKKSLVDEVINRHRLWGRVRCTGNVPQQEGARLLKACDIFVSPHNAHMVDSRFFGSPTKIFEYMGMGAGIVASDLEQIGEVLSPALRPSELADPPLIDAQRAILCTPGNLAEFVDAVVFLCRRPDIAAALGANARKAAEDEFTWSHHVQRLLAFAAGEQAPLKAKDPVPPARLAGSPLEVPTFDGAELVPLATGDGYKDEAQNQWDNDPCGSHYVKDAKPHTLEWFLEAERYRYGEYAPWMPEVMEFAGHAGERLLEIGAGMGIDHAQFARHGAIVTDVDLSAGHLALARENFALHGLQGSFVHHDAETLPFDDNCFDVVYSNGVIHHTPNTQQVVDEIHRVLKPGGKAIVMVYAENSLHYWRNLVGWIGLVQGRIYNHSIGKIMSESVEISGNDARPLVKVYTAQRLRNMFAHFNDIYIVKHQITAPEVPRLLKRMSLDTIGNLMGWNLIIKARKPK